MLEAPVNYGGQEVKVAAKYWNRFLVKSSIISAHFLLTQFSFPSSSKI